ncbi:protein translocase subunit SecD [Streptomyces sp. MS19]|uniref:protein translocase subunit SecD n=1 Tax=Streptomyces sp. MS19 TaxID=3385972 RepID=UPI00399F47C9
MATPKKGVRPSSSRKRGSASRGAHGHPGRSLLFVLLAIAALTGGMFLSGHTTPRLGIDLAGGTSITLEARSDDGDEAINSTNMNTAVNIIERRVNGLGVSEAEVQTQGDRNIIVNIPKGADEQQAREQVGTTAQLGFRPVLTAVPAQAMPDGGESPAPEEGSEDPAEEPSGDPSADTPSDDPSAETGDEDATDEGAADEDGASDGESPDAQGMPAPGGATTADTASFASYRTDEGDTEAPAADETPAEDAPADGATEDGDAAAAAAADLQAQLDALDCSTPEARLDADRTAAAADDADTVITCDSEGQWKYALGPVAVPGTDIEDSSAVFDTQRGQGWIVQMEFTDAGADKFGDVTGQLASQPQPQNQFAIVLDGEVVSAPSVSTRLGGGSAEISGSFTQESAEDLSNMLRYGALPLSFDEASVSTVSPTLGGEQLRAGLIAGAIGLALVVLYMLVYYRGLALIALASLAVSSIFTYTIMALLGPAIGFALNLPAVCGAIVAIGITADSFIVYFERIRDEVREGRTLRPAVERAWPRARRTILVSDFVSFLAAAVLFVVTVGKVQGFAFTLGLTTALDVAVVFLFTKPLMTLLARRKFFSSGHSWSGLDPKRLGARPPLRRTGRRPAPVPSDPKEA